METALCCTSCGEVVFKSIGDSTKLRAKVLIFKENHDHAFAVCKGCGSEIPVPIVLDTSLMKSMERTAKTRLYIRK